MIYKEINSLGISTTQLRIKKDKEKRNLYFCVKDLEKYNRLIGFSCEEKLKKLKQLIKIKKENRKVTENLLLEAIGQEKKTLEELILQLQAPYHRIRRTLINLSLKGKIDTQKIGNKNYYLATRQTRYP
jgi:predicted Rossmann fold nucleotide-binding protein DprA/Smf involved in DNA uptake